MCFYKWEKFLQQPITEFRGGMVEYIESIMKTTDLPLLNIPSVVNFQMQLGLTRDSVSMEIPELNLKSLKDLACNFVDRKVPEHGLNRLPERLILLRHDYSSENILLPINCISDISEGTVVEIVLSSRDLPEDNVDIRPHALNVHSYKSPTFCDFCGEMLFGLVRQGLKCEGCGQNYHKRCAYKIPNNCTHIKRRRSSFSSLLFSPTKSSGGDFFKEKSAVHRTASAAPFIDDHNALLCTPNLKEKRPSLNMGRPVWVEKELANKIRIPHTFLVHSYGKPTVCQHCRKLLKGLFRQGLQCKDCKFNVHRKCLDRIPMDCPGEAEWANEEPCEAENAEYMQGDDTDDEPESFTAPPTVDITPPPCAVPKVVTKVLQATGSQDSGSEQDEPKANNENSNSSNIPLMRIVQSVKHTKKGGQSIVKEGWLMHFTNKDSFKRKHFWRLDTKTLTLYQNEGSTKFFKEIPLDEVLAVEPCKDKEGRGAYCLELKTKNCTYFFGSEKDISWEVAIRQALLPLMATKENVKAEDGADAESPADDGDDDPSQDISLHYQIFPEEVLGSGQFGIVYGGVHRKKGQQVAIKVIDKLRFPHKEEAALKNEVQILHNIQHPAVVNLERMFETPERVFVVMEKLKGDMLEMILNSSKGRLPERTAKFLIYQILVALRHLHAKNIVHCDLKPENVLLSTDSQFPQLKLCDFGFARIIGEKSFRRSVVGTPAYLAPEVLRNKGYNRLLDMWSVGVIIYVTLSGTFPFNEDEDINDQIQNADFMYPPLPWREISNEAIHLINSLLQVKVAKRYTVDKSLAHSWLQDYQTWLDLRRLEAEVGIRYLTHESDDPRWEKHRQVYNLEEPPPPPPAFAEDSDSGRGLLQPHRTSSHQNLRQMLSIQPELTEPAPQSGVTASLSCNKLRNI
ncbi:serine/threonine-protein kinase D3-like [Galendromus occidentalis]|uniref:protein kinase C n=1 Tax=Galendromus occidentalis TaxID=34638 RepID=A0AAJ6W0Q0_9ACAR|nr:serine/threonine-protein kinase D3-like [Galendromus occidentalis]